MAKKTEIVKIDPAQFGIEESKAAEISAMFKPMLDKMVELETEYNALAKGIKDEPTKEQTIKAHDLRMQYVKTRTGTAQIHKDLKAFYLAGGRFVDGWKSAQLMAAQGIEDKLLAIEKYAEIKRQEEVEKLEAERIVEMREYNPEFPGGQLGQLEEDVYQMMLTGAKMRKEQADRKAAEEEAERLNAEKKAAEERKALQEAAKKAQEEAEQARKELEAERKAAEAEARERDRIREEQEKAAAAEKESWIKKEQEKFLKEREAAKKEMEAEIEKAKKAADANKAKIDEGEDLSVLAGLDDAATLVLMQQALRNAVTRYQFTGKKFVEAQKGSVTLVEKIIAWTNEKVA